MGTADGTVIGLIPLIENGPAADQCNIVLVAEGFTAAEQTLFNDLCDDFVAVLEAEPWYGTAGSPLNVYRLNVESDESGADDPDECGGDGTTADTYFDAQFCNGDPPIRRCLSGDEPLVRDEIDAVLGEWHAAGVLVNTTQYGGCRSGNVFFTSTGTGWQNTAIHEFGHAAFGLADEYDYWSDCPSENARTSAEEPNVTRSTTEATLKWRHLVTPGVPIPTMLNSDCSMCNTAPNVLPDDTAIGLFEGARYEHCNMFRPAYTCRMRNSENDFCRVCVEEIAIDLGSFVDAEPVLDVVPAALDFGEVASGLTLYLSFEVRNFRSGHPMPMQVTLSAPTGGFFYPDGVETSFTLPAPVFSSFTSRNVYVAFTADSVAAPSASGEIVVSTAGGDTLTVTLDAISVPPVPVDTVMVVDRSGSMSDATGVPGQTKIDHAIEAGELYVSLLKPTDQIGIVRYNQSSGASDRILTMRTAGDLETGAGRLAANSALDVSNLNPAGSTSIGAGIINGSDLLDGAGADARALLVLTDGRQNTSPNVAGGQAVVTTKTPRQRVFAVGLGLNQLEDTLNQIATVTDGVAQVTGDLVDEREFLLQKLYVQILSDASDEAFVRDPIDYIRPGQRKSTPVFLSEIDIACDFIVTWRPSPSYPKYLRIWLEAPDGTVIEPSSAVPAVDYIQRQRHAYYRVRFPFNPEKPQGHVGVWKVWLESIKGASEFLHTLKYSVMAKARSNLLLRGRVTQETYVPGSKMLVTLEPSLFGQPVALADPVQAKITRPDGLVRTIGMISDSDGSYRGTYTDTPFVGPYRVECEVTAKSPQGHLVTRYRTMTGLIFVEREGDDETGRDDGHESDGGGLTPEECAEARNALKVLQKYLELCCRR